MDNTTVTALTQLGLSSIFAIACVQLFLRLEKRYDAHIAQLREQITELYKQNTLLTEQNKQLSVALFANNADAQRAYTAMVKSTSMDFKPLPTDITP